MKNRKYLMLFTLFAMNLVDQPAPLVMIEQGILSGKVSADGTFFEYIGIPYGAINSSSRFQAPLPPPVWEGTFNAIEEYSCPQNTFIGVIGTEECLRINVYVPALTKGTMAVMAYIHGGAFSLGSGGKLLYAPDLLVKHDVVLVTFNYRLGPLGFLCLGIKEAPGNAGLKDQIAALRWIKKNIAAFGGDPDNVTIFGESAGGTSVSLLLASEATNGLFNRAIVQSGSALALWATNRRPLWTASLLAKELGYDTDNPHELYEILSKVPYKDLIKAKIKKPTELVSDGDITDLPCVEKPFPGIEPVFTDVPYNVITKNPKNISIIFGTTSQEGLFLISLKTEDDLSNKNYRYLFGSDLEFPSAEEANATAREIKEFYFGEESISMRTRLKLSELYTHLYFELPVILEAEMYAAKNKAPIYNYLFNYSGGRNFLKHRTGFSEQPGACHGDDILYLFNGYIWPYRINENDMKIIKWMTSMWTNFAKHGNPTPESSNLPVKWFPSNETKLNVLYMQEDMKMGSIPNQEAYRLWKNVYSKYRKNKF